ncbi:MAG: MFS transporter [Sphingomonadales bacterium]
MKRAEIIDAPTDAQSPTDSQAATWPSPARAWTMVFILLIAYISSFIDRQLVTLLVDPIQKDLRLTDTEFSLLAGAAFSLFYMSMGIPLGWLADRYSRRLIIMSGVFFWSLMTVLTGFANTFWKMFGARMGVAIGEAALSPAAFSLIADSFPAQRRGKAIAVYTMGAYIGAGLALVIGGSAVALISRLPPFSVPGFGDLAPWQTTFILVGAPGFLIALAMLLVREPKRQGVLKVGTMAEPMKGNGTLWWFLKTRWQAVTLVTMAYSLFGMAPIGYMMWTPAIMYRRFEWDALQVGTTYGLILLVFSTAGVYLGGVLADRLTKRQYKDASTRAAMLIFLIGTPFAALAPIMPSSTGLVVMLAAASFFFGAVQSLPALSLQLITPNQVRAQIIAIYFLVGNLISMGIGPTLIALISDYVLGGQGNIALALAIVAGTVMPVSALIMYFGLKFYRQSVDDAQAWTDPGKAS